MRSKIKKTKLIYKFDPRNRTNFHQYIDNLNHLVLIIKTKNGVLLAGWSEGSFYPKMQSKKNGIIFSLTNSKYY